MPILATVWALSLALARVAGYSSGQVGTACSDMVPGHPGRPQNAASNYSIGASSATFNPGDEVVVRVSVGVGGSPFSGFLLEALEATGGLGRPLGTFSVTAGGPAQAIACGGQANAAASHRSSEAKTEVQVTWVAPAVSPDYIMFRATVVRDIGTYWVALRGPVVSRPGLPTLSPGVLPSDPPPRPSLDVGTLAGPVSDSGCGVDRTCLRWPPGCSLSGATPCVFVSLAATGGAVAVEMSGPDNGYLAVGFSNDTWMGDDDIYVCVRTTNGVDVHSAVSSGRSYPGITAPVGMSGAAARVSDGRLQCSFVRTEAPPSPASADFARPYFLFLAHGPSDSGLMLKHDSQPVVSRGLVTPNGPPSEVAGSRSPTIIKAHGALMMVAWLSCSAVGIVIARFFKPLWPTRSVFGQKVWFQMHRGLMSVAVLLSLSAFALPFVYRGGWSHGAHPVLGCLVLLLAVAQPIMASRRPHPGEPRRKLFNWAHWATGTVARIMAVAAMFLGVDLPALDLPDSWDKLTLVGAVVWQVATELVLEANHYRRVRAGSVSGTEMRGVGAAAAKPHGDDSHSGHLFQKVVLGVYISGNVAFLVTFLVAIAHS